MKARMTWPVMIGWEGGNFSDRELATLQEAALDMLRTNMHLEKKVYFTHRDCEGILECKGDGRFGTYSGVLFFADLPHEKGENRTAQFLILQSVIDAGLREGDSAMITRFKDGDVEERGTDIRIHSKPKLVPKRSVN